MLKRLCYSISLLIIFVIIVTKGDKIFIIPEPPPKTVAIENKPKNKVSPYINISPFDIHFREAADSLGWDWKFLAAIGFIESRFDSTARSDVGASGVMQVMPRTLQQFGIPDSLHLEPRSNIIAATELLRSLNHIFRRIDNFEERSNFILASYNAGIGHVSDAMRLADKHGHNRYKWKNSVDTFLKLKRLPEYYTDSLCKNGQFSDWKQTLQFVEKVKRTWRMYEDRQEAYNDSIYEMILNDSTIEVDRG